MLSVAGGKLTTYRRIGLDALDVLRSRLGIHRLDQSPRPLPGAGRIAYSRELGELEPHVRAHLLHLYGSLVSEVLAEATSEDELRPLHPRAPDVAAQIAYAYRREWAVTPEDVLRRRTTLALRGLDASVAHQRWWTSGATRST